MAWKSNETSDSPIWPDDNSLNKPIKLTDDIVIETIVKSLSGDELGIKLAELYGIKPDNVIAVDISIRPGASPQTQIIFRCCPKWF